MDSNVEQRKPLRAFANRMEQVLAENDHKCGWEGSSAGWLLERAVEEVKEAVVAFKEYVKLSLDPEVNYSRSRALQNELIDTANFCMMAWDRLEDEIRSAPTPKPRQIACLCGKEHPDTVKPNNKNDHAGNCGCNACF